MDWASFAEVLPSGLMIFLIQGPSGFQERKWHPVIVLCVNRHPSTSGTFTTQVPTESKWFSYKS